jgi:hypothetical protein
MKWEDAAMRVLLISLGVFALVSFAVCPFTATAAGSADVRAKCQEKYPDAGPTAERRRNYALRKQCMASGGKS